jgi:TolB-like protein|tara:strand:- start:3042 stop:4892 length:1851 start_codon:yes stop_codon:yes gene_type:complete
MANIFFSYASQDRERVRPLVEYLQTLGWSVWWDRDLIAGPSFDEKIEAEIAAASCVVVAWSQHAIHSRWVRAEANEAFDREILVPILIEDVRPPLVFRTAQTANLTGWPHQTSKTELDALVEGIRERLGHPSKPVIAEPTIDSQSIAVLRFSDMSEAGARAALCSGIAEEILNKLSQNRHLKVIARTSSFLFDSTTASIREIGQRLGVANVLEGSVRTSGNQIRIAAQLVECKSETQRWTGSYTRELADLFTLYDEVAGAVYRELDILIGSDVTRPAVPPTESEEAQMLVMNAKFKFDETYDPWGSMPLVEKALTLDPNYAAAHCLKGHLLFHTFEGGHVVPEPAMKAAKASIQQALALDPDLELAHRLMGAIHMNLDLDFAMATKAYHEQERICGYSAMGNLLFTTGHYREALDAIQHEEEYDPVNFRPKYLLARILARLNRMDDATAKYEQANEISPRNEILFHAQFLHFLFRVKDVDLAEGYVAKTRYDGRALPWARAMIANYRGEPKALLVLVQHMVRNRGRAFVSARFISDTYFYLGKYEEHIRWFTTRVKEKDVLIQILDFLEDHPDYWETLSAWAHADPDKTEARLELLSDHRRKFNRIAKKIGLPQTY